MRAISQEFWRGFHSLKTPLALRREFQVWKVTMREPADGRVTPRKGGGRAPAGSGGTSVGVTGWGVSAPPGGSRSPRRPSPPALADPPASQNLRGAPQRSGPRKRALRIHTAETRTKVRGCFLPEKTLPRTNVSSEQAEQTSPQALLKQTRSFQLKHFANNASERL